MFSSTGRGDFLAVFNRNTTTDWLLRSSFVERLVSLANSNRYLYLGGKRTMEDGRVSELKISGWPGWMR